MHAGAWGWDGVAWTLWHLTASVPSLHSVALCCLAGTAQCTIQWHPRHCLRGATYWTIQAVAQGSYHALALLQAFGDTYKWMLYGDDDTMFFVEGVQDLVKDLDPDLPYFVTGIEHLSS